MLYVILKESLKKKFFLLISLFISFFFVLLIFLLTPKFNTVVIAWPINLIVNAEKPEIRKNNTLENYSSHTEPDSAIRKPLSDNISDSMQNAINEYIRTKILADLYNDFDKFQQKMGKFGILVSIEGLSTSELQKEKNFIKFIFSKKIYYKTTENIIDKNFVEKELKLLISSVIDPNNKIFLDPIFFVTTENFNIKLHIYKLLSSILFLTIFVNFIIFCFIEKKIKFDKLFK